MKNILEIEKHITTGNDALIHRHNRLLKGQFIFGVLLIDSKKYDEELYIYEKDLLNSEITRNYFKSHPKRTI